jgi:4-amino-4-deoxy-L-arabinose transferase-like glycosyltransferase
MALTGEIKQEYFFRPYAPFVPLVFSFVYLLGGTSPTVVFSLFYLSLIGIFYITMQAETRDQKLSIIFTGIVASTPFLWWHSYLGLLNFTAGYFFTLGCLYFIRFLKDAKDSRLLIIAGMGFGLAAFTRLEYLIYFLGPLLLFIFWGGSETRKLLALSFPALLPASLWSVYGGIRFTGMQGMYGREEVFIIASLWGFLVIVSIGKRYFKSILRYFTERWWIKRYFLVGLLLVLFFAGVVFFFSPLSLPLTAASLGVVCGTGMCVFFRLLAGNIFWLFTSSLIILLLGKPFYRSLTFRTQTFSTFLLIAVYYFMHVVIHTYHTYAHDPAGTHPYHVSLIANLKWLFLSPGNFFNTSEVRDLLAINPLMVLLFGYTCCSVDIREKRKRVVSWFLWSILCLNMITLSVVFLWPRLSFLSEYRHASVREMLLSPGPKDNPNMEHLRRIYKLMYFIKDHTEEESSIYFIKPHFSQAEAYKILLPRGVKFIESDEESSFFESIQRLPKGMSYLAFKKENLPELAKERKIEWNDEGWGICKVW